MLRETIPGVMLSWGSVPGPGTEPQQVKEGAGQPCQESDVILNGAVRTVSAGGETGGRKGHWGSGRRSGKSCSSGPQLSRRGALPACAHVRQIHGHSNTSHTHAHGDTDARACTCTRPHTCVHTNDRHVYRCTCMCTCGCGSTAGACGLPHEHTHTAATRPGDTLAGMHTPCKRVLCRGSTQQVLPEGAEPAPRGRGC